LVSNPADKSAVFSPDLLYQSKAWVSNPQGQSEEQERAGYVAIKRMGEVVFDCPEE
jgi:hypothetical protein